MNIAMKIGFTCSAFDLCHAGHMLLFKEAKQNCDYLIVGLQSDPSSDNDINIQYRGKLKNKPVMSLAERKEILEGIKYIDEIFVYSNEEDLYKNIQRLKEEGRYQIRFIGDDYKGKHYTGDDIEHQIHYVSRNHGYSTSELRQRVYKAELAEMAKKAQMETIKLDMEETEPMKPRGRTVRMFKNIVKGVKKFSNPAKEKSLPEGGMQTA
jgi:glycerol-3-phosphate cytidylyltransferase